MRRAAPAFEILMFAPVRRFFPEPRQRLNGGWRRSRVLHPSEDLSELPPLRSVVAGQEYHCPRTRSLRGSLPKLLLDGWVPLVTFLGRLYTENLYRWSSRIRQIAVPFLAHPLDVMSVAGYVLFKLHESVLKIPLTPYPYSRPCCTKLFSSSQKFQQFCQNCTLLVVQCHERNAEFFGRFPFAAIFEEKHINELPLIL